MNAVVTYIFGENQEILREPLVLDHNVDYICVTDQPSLTSKHWRIIVDDIPQAKCTRDKMPWVKYNPFKYTNADRIIVMDGTLQVIKSLTILFNQLNTSPLLIKRHPQRSNLLEELNAWIELRHMDASIKDKFYTMSSIDHIPLSNSFLVESCIIGYRRIPVIQTLCNAVLAYMNYLGNNGIMCMTNQCPLTYLIEKFSIKYDYINQLNIAMRYRHNSWTLANR